MLLNIITLFHFVNINALFLKKFLFFLNHFFFLSSKISLVSIKLSALKKIVRIMHKIILKIKILPKNKFSTDFFFLLRDLLETQNIKKNRCDIKYMYCCGNCNKSQQPTDKKQEREEIESENMCKHLSFCFSPHRFS